MLSYQETRIRRLTAAAAATASTLSFRPRAEMDYAGSWGCPAFDLVREGRCRLTLTAHVEWMSDAVKADIPSRPRRLCP